MLLTIDYNNASSIEIDSNDSNVNLATNFKRKPVYFSSIIKNPMLFRIGLQALKSVIHSDDNWVTDYEFKNFMLDPVVTVHSDEVFFEAFSQDESSYGRLSIPTICFEETEETQFGTTNIDFTWAFSKALDKLRSTKTTHFNVGQKSVEIATTGSKKHTEKKVDIPESWLKGFLQLQAGLTLPSVSFDISPAELLNVIWFLRDNKAKMSPRAMRFELTQNEPVNLILEPWEEKFTFKKTLYQGRDRTIRIWGRRRLRILENILPYCDKVSIYLCGRAMPNFYVCHMEYGGIFLLALSSWTANDWSKGSNFSSLMPQGYVTEDQIKTILTLLMERKVLSLDNIVNLTGIPQINITEGLFKLCKSGNCTFDIVNNAYRHRQLFDENIDVKSLFDEDERFLEAKELIENNNIQINNIDCLEWPVKRKYVDPLTGKLVEKEVDKKKELRVKATVIDNKEGTLNVKLSVNDEGRIVFASCTCKFFDYNILSRGLCKHIQAVNLLSNKEIVRSEEYKVTGELN